MANIFKRGKDAIRKTHNSKRKKYKKSPLKDSPRKRKLVKGLMKARRDVKTALDKKNAKSERNARNRVQKFKVLLGERSGKKTR